MDTYATHLMASVKKKLKNRQVDIAFVPGGCTSFIQAPDVVWNKPFKDHCTTLYSNWFINEGLDNVTRQGNLRAPPRAEIVRWILEAWKQLSKEVIADSFLKCGLTSDETNYRNITCFKKPSLTGGIEMLGDAITLSERDEGNPFAADYEPDEDDIDAADPFNDNNMECELAESELEEIEIDIENLVENDETMNNLRRACQASTGPELACQASTGPELEQVGPELEQVQE